MTMPDLFEQLDSPAETGDDWIRRLLSEPDETPSPTPAAGDDGTDTGHEPDLPQEEERIVPPQASGPGAGGDVTAPPPPGAHPPTLPARAGAGCIDFSATESAPLSCSPHILLQCN